MHSDIAHNSPIPKISLRTAAGKVTLPSGSVETLPWPLSPVAGATRRALQAPTFALLGGIAPASVSGTERLAELSSSVLFAANHTSHLDTLALLRALPEPWRRRLVVAAAADYFYTQPLIGTGVSLLVNAFPFSRTASAHHSLERCALMLDHGWSILLYPEGSRSCTGEIAPFKAGIGMLAVKLGVPVVPVCIEGLFKVLPKGQFVPHRNPIHVSFGQPLTFNAGTAYGAAASAVRQAVCSLAQAQDAQPLSQQEERTS